MWYRPFRRAALPLVLVPALAGCSLLFVHGPPDNHRDLTEFECTESRFAPILDLILAGSSFLAAGEAQPDYGPAYGGAQQDNSYNILNALLYGISGATGMSRVAECRRAKQELRERLGASGSPTSR